MPLSAERKIMLGVCTALLALALISIGAWRSSARLEDTFRQVDHTHQVLYELEALRTQVVSVQTESQRYVITGDETCLDRWAADTKQAGDLLAHLRELTRDNPAQNQRINQLELLIASVVTLTRQRHELRQRSGPAAAFAEVGKGDVRRTIDAFTVQVQSTEDTERELLRERTLKTQSAGRLTLLVVVASSVLAAVLVLVAVALAFRDFARRKQAEQELDRFFSLSQDMLCIAGFDGYFKRLNPAWEKTFGFTVAELTAKPFMDFIHPDDREPTKAQAARQAGGLEVLSFENRYLCKDGSYRWLVWNARPLVAEQLIFAIARDTTDRKADEEQIRRLNQELKERAGQLEVTNRELEAFSYSVSHDLRAPLRHIDGFTGLLQKRIATTLDDQSRRYLTVISDAARQMGRLIDDLLSFSRMGRAEMHVTMVDQNALVTSVIQEGQFDDAGRRIEWHIAPLPTIRADGSMLRQVWLNLIANAVKYSGKVPQPRIEIGVQADAASGGYVFHVRDNGAGFDMKYVDKLFGVFQRLHSNEEFEGTGIGLANVRRVITRHGGRTWAEGCVGAGAVFYFSIPPATLVPSPAR